MKKKILLPSLAVLSASTVVAPLLTSCANSEGGFTRYDAIGGEYDKEYNINKATYKALKGELVRQYDLKLRTDPATKDDEKLIRKAEASLSKVLSKFDIKLLSNKRFSYTVITNSMIEMASQRYGIKLVRNTTIQEGDFQKLIEGLCKSFELYMIHLNIKPEVRQEIITKAKQSFNDLLDELNEKYSDPLMKLIHAKSQIALCFTDINTDIALWAANIRLQQFLSEYGFELNNDTDGKQVRLDNVKTWTWTDEKSGKAYKFEKGADLTGVMNRLFKIRKVGDTSDTPVIFVNDLLPGYTLTPVLYNISENPITNNYSFTIDWQCVKTSYLKDPTEAEEATAHLRDMSNSVHNYDFYNEDPSTMDVRAVDLAKNAPIKGVSYPIFLTAEKEKETLMKTYFNKSSSNQSTKYIDFHWDKEEDPTRTDYAAFFQGEHIKTDDAGREYYDLNVAALSNAGLMVAAKSIYSNDEVEYTRIEDIIGNGIFKPSERTSGTEDLSDELVNQFFENCDLTAVSNILDSAHDVKLSTYATYKNTLEENDDLTKAPLSYNLDTNKMELGQSTYYALTQTYNQLLSFERQYTNNIYEDMVDDMNDELILTFAFFQLGVTLNGIAMMGMFVNPPKIGFFITLMFLAIASDACQGLFFWLFISKKYDPTLEMSENCQALKDSPEGQAMVDMLRSDANAAGLLEANEDMEMSEDEFNSGLNEFKNKQWIVIKPIVDRYARIKDNPTYKAFQNKIDELGLAPERFKKIMKPWEFKGAYWLWSLLLDAFSLGLDITAACVAGAVPPAAPSAQGRVSTKLELENTKRFSQAKINKYTRKHNKYFSATPLDNFPKRVQNLPYDELNEVTFGQSLPQSPKEQQELAKQAGKCDLPVGYCFQKFYKQHCPEYGTADLLDIYGMDCHKLLAKNYGGSEKCIKNLINELKTVDADGRAALPLGPEALERVLSRDSEEYGSVISFLEQDLLPIVEGQREFKLSESVPKAIEAITKEERTIDEMADALQTIWNDIRTDFECTPLSEFKCEMPLQGDGFLEVFAGRFFNAFAHTWGDVFDSIMVHLKLLKRM